MQRRYATIDVFTTEPMCGNPVAVVLDAEGLTTPQMQALAAEFNYSETTFVLPPADPANTAHVRIFTPDREIPFAGHPNIGTAFFLAHQQTTGTLSNRFVFEEAAGLVEIDLFVERNSIVGANLLSPQPLKRGAQVTIAQAAASLGLLPEDVCTDMHAPQVASVGLPFLIVELASREALQRASPNRQAYDTIFPLDGARAVYAYTRSQGKNNKALDCDLHSRMFTWRLTEDPATGSATAALAALLADLQGKDVCFQARQGEDMGRPSMILSRTVSDGANIRAYVGGHCVTMFAGTFEMK